MPCLQSRENAYVRGAEPETKTGGPKAARRLTPRHKAVEDGAGAQTHGAVDAARGFAGGIETRNRFLIHDVEDLALHVGEQTAHAVMDLRAHFGDVEGRFADRLCFLVEAAAEVGVLAGCVSSL